MAEQEPKYYDHNARPLPWLIPTEDELIIGDIIDKHGHIELGNFTGKDDSEKRETAQKFLTRFNIDPEQTAVALNTETSRKATLATLKARRSIEIKLLWYLPAPAERRGSSYIINDILDTRSSKDFTVIRDKDTGITDLVTSSNTDIAELEEYLLNHGSTYVRTLTTPAVVQGLGDRYFANKEVYSGQLDKGEIKGRKTHDITEAVALANNTQVKKLDVIYDDLGKPYLYLQPYYEEEVVIPNPTELEIERVRTANTFETTQESKELFIAELASKYLAKIERGEVEPSNLLYDIPESSYQHEIENIYIDTAPSSFQDRGIPYVISARIDGIDFENGEVTRAQFDRYTHAEDWTLASHALAAQVFAKDIARVATIDNPREIRRYYEAYKENKDMISSSFGVYCDTPEGDLLTFGEDADKTFKILGDEGAQSRHIDVDGQTINYTVVPGAFTEDLSILNKLRLNWPEGETLNGFLACAPHEQEDQTQAQSIGRKA